jgi:hypothetical protein
MEHKVTAQPLGVTVAGDVRGATLPSEWRVLKP